MEEEIHWMKCPSFQRGHSLVTLRPREAYLETTWGQIKRMQALYTPWSLSATLLLNQRYKTPHQIPPPTPPWDPHFFEGTSLQCPPFAWQSNISTVFNSYPKLYSLWDSIWHQWTEAEFLVLPQAKSRWLVAIVMSRYRGPTLCRYCLI